MMVVGRRCAFVLLLPLPLPLRRCIVAIAAPRQKAVTFMSCGTLLC